VTLRPYLRKLLKIPFIILYLAVLSGAWLWFGKGGFARLFHSEAERQATVERVHKLAEENEALLKEVHLLRGDPGYLESVARRELNLIKEKEVLYRFEKSSKTSADESKPSKGTTDLDGKK